MWIPISGQFIDDLSWVTLLSSKPNGAKKCFTWWGGMVADIKIICIDLLLNCVARPFHCFIQSGGQFLIL
jgi:hypothetical protein